MIVPANEKIVCPNLLTPPPLPLARTEAPVLELQQQAKREEESQQLFHNCLIFYAFVRLQASPSVHWQMILISEVAFLVQSPRFCAIFSISRCLCWKMCDFRAFLVGVLLCSFNTFFLIGWGGAGGRRNCVNNWLKWSFFLFIGPRIWCFRGPAAVFLMLSRSSPGCQGGCSEPIRHAVHFGGMKQKNGNCHETLGYWILDNNVLIWSPPKLKYYWNVKKPKRVNLQMVGLTINHRKIKVLFTFSWESLDEKQREKNTSFVVSVHPNWRLLLIRFQISWKIKI